MPGPVWKEPAAQARAAADVMASRALDRHPDLPEKSLVQRVYGEPSTRSGVVEGWDAPPPTIVSDDFQSQRAALRDLPPQEDIYGLPNAVSERDRQARSALTMGNVLHGEPMGQRLGEDVFSFQDYDGQLTGLTPPTENFQWPPIGSPVTQDYWSTERFPESFAGFKTESGNPLVPTGEIYDLSQSTIDALDGVEPEYGNMALLREDTANAYAELKRRFADEFNGKQLKLASAYRNKAHNSALKNSDPNSPHMEGDAVDISFKGLSAKEKKWLKAAGKKIGLEFKEYDGSHHFNFIRPSDTSFLDSFLADRVEADDVGMIEAVDAAEVPDTRFDMFRPGQDLGMVDPGQAYPGSVRLGAPGPVTPGAVEDPYWAGERFPESTYLGSERQVADTAAWQQMLEEKAMREAMEGYGPRTAAPVASALGATDYPFQTGHNVVGYGAGGLGDIPPADIMAARMGDSAAPVLPVEEGPGARVSGPFIPYPTNVHPDAMVPPYWAGERFPEDAPYPVPTGQDDPAETPFASRTSDATIEGMIRDAERSGRSLDRRFAGMGEGPSGDIGRLPWDQPPAPSAEAVEAVEIYRSEAADELRDTLRAEGSNEAIALADQLDIEQRFGAGQDFDKSAFYFPEDTTEDDTSRAAQLAWMRENPGASRLDAYNAVVLGVSPEYAFDQRIEDEFLARPPVEGPGPRVEGPIIDYPTNIHPDVMGPPPVEEPRPMVAGTVAAPQPQVAGMDVEPAPTAPTAQDELFLGGDTYEDVFDPTATAEGVGPPVLEQAETVADWTAALYGEPPNVPQFPVVPQPGTPELTKMGFYAKDYRQSDLVNPPSEMIRNAFPWAKNLPTDVLERAARDGEFFRSLVDQYEARAGGPMGFGQPEALGVAPPWVNPDVAAPPANFGADRGPSLPPELAAQIASAGGAPVEEVEVDASVADARAVLNEWVDEHGDNLLQYFNIDVSPLKGTFSKADIESFYQQLLKIKDRKYPFTGKLIFSPDVWEKVEFIYRTLG